MSALFEAQFLTSSIFFQSFTEVGPIGPKEILEDLFKRIEQSQIVFFAFYRYLYFLLNGLKNVFSHDCKICALYSARGARRFCDPEALNTFSFFAFEFFQTKKQ